jgi:hypothetical protein
MRRLVAIVALLTSVVTASACDGNGRGTPIQQASNSRPVYCTIIADGPRRDVDKAKNIVARVRFRCDNPGAEALTLAVRLEKRDGTAWTLVGSRTFTARGEETRAESFKYRNRELTVGCATGTYRTTVQWTSRSRGQSREGTSRSAAAPKPCRPRILT